MKECAEFSKEATPEVTKEEPILEKIQQEHIKSRTTPSVDFAVPNETNKRSLSSVKPRREFEPMCHTRLSEEIQVHTYMHARIKFHAYSDIKVNTETVSQKKTKDN
jgi:hypothetical protein